MHDVAKAEILLARGELHANMRVSAVPLVGGEAGDTLLCSVVHANTFKPRICDMGGKEYLTIGIWPVDFEAIVQE